MFYTTIDLSVRLNIFSMIADTTDGRAPNTVVVVANGYGELIRLITVDFCWCRYRIPNESQLRLEHQQLPGYRKNTEKLVSLCVVSADPNSLSIKSSSCQRCSRTLVSNPFRSGYQFSQRKQKFTHISKQ